MPHQDELMRLILINELSLPSLLTRNKSEAEASGTETTGSKGKDQLDEEVPLKLILYVESVDLQLEESLS